MEIQALNFGLADSFNFYSQKVQKPDQSPDWHVRNMTSPPEIVDFEIPKSQSSHNQSSSIENFKKGTTTLGFKFKEGIILAVDSRASMGSFISSEQVRKVIEINDYLLGTMAGGAADCQYWESYLANHCRQYELTNGCKLSVAGASKYFQNILTKYKGRGLSVGAMIAGNDDKGQHLYFNDNDGLRLLGDLFSCGSGSTYAYGVLDTYYRYDMSLDEAVELGVRAIYHATHRDTGSGGVVRVYHIHNKGWTKIHEGIDNNSLHYQFAKEKNLQGDQDEAKQRLF